DFARISKAIKITRKEGKSKDGKPFMVWESPGGFAQIRQWVVYKGNASQGQQALGISLVGNQQYITYAPGKFELPPEPVFYYGLLNNSYAGPNGVLFNTCGVFRRVFPVDWSDYDLLRLDAYGEEVMQTVRVLLEDEEIGPHIIRNLARSSAPPTA